MSNPFDEFDSTPNPFDEFDEVKQGSSFGLQMDVSKGKKPEDKLTILRRQHPDAVITDNGSFVYTDAKGSKRTLNAEGADLGDVAGANPMRLTAEMIGGSIGAGAAGILGNLGPQAAFPEEIVTVPAAYGAGAAVAGEVFDLGQRIFNNVPDTRDIPERVLGVATDFVSNAVGQRGGELLGHLATEFKDALIVRRL